ncbi:MAG: aminoacyl-tRNA hydrolase, partial [Bifidobacteriaceae bacterium]|nr:aminoacyl-tRNA hydrolase [Bifidobacteriaceae bacterium]
MSDVWLVVGLGNPGPNYARNRHNLGFMTVDVLAGRFGGAFAGRAHRRALAGAVRLGWAAGGRPGPRAVLVKPQTFMNLSGGPTSELMDYFGVPVERLIVVHDDLDLPPWEVRLKRGGGEGGHNGLRDISRALGTKDYIRVRCGIGRPPGRTDAVRYVLADFPASQRVDVALLVDKAADAVQHVAARGLDSAQLAFHTKATPPGGAPTPAAPTPSGRADAPGGAPTPSGRA